MKTFFKTLILTTFVSTSALAAGYNEVYVDFVKGHSMAQHKLRFANPNGANSRIAQAYNFAVVRIITIEEAHDMNKPQFTQVVLNEVKSLRAPILARSDVKEAYRNLKSSLIEYLETRLRIMNVREGSIDKRQALIRINALMAAKIGNSSNMVIRSNEEAAMDLFLIKQGFVNFLTASAAELRK